MAAKTFVPQYARILGHLSRYITKHRAKMVPYMTTQQITDMDYIVTAAGLWSGYPPAESP